MFCSGIAWQRSTPFILLQPRLRLHDTLSSTIHHRDYSDDETAFVGLVPGTGSLLHSAQTTSLSLLLANLRPIHQITSGLRHLHALKIVHHDIKLQNILISGAKRASRVGIEC